MAPKKPKYELDDLLKVRETTKDAAEVVRKISNSECGEHLLRSSSTSTLHPRRLRTSSIVTNPYEDIPSEQVDRRGGKIRRSARHSKYSPTPSFKRGKAEQLLKEHGSPPGIRVTAGGRIVPDGLSPLTSPHFDIGGQFKPGFSNGGYQFPTFVAPRAINNSNNNGLVFSHGNGTYYQVVDGLFRRVVERNGQLQLYMPPTNLAPYPTMLPYLAMQVPSQPLSTSFPHQPVMPTGAAFDGNVTSPLDVMPTPREVRVMEEVHARLEQELKELNRNEVLQRSSLNASKRQDIVRTRVALTERIDHSRRVITEAKQMLENGESVMLHNNVSGNFFTAQVQLTVPQGVQALDNSAHIGPLAYGSGYLSQPSSFHSRRLQPELPEFVPRSFNTTVPSAVGGSSPIVLQERAGNAGQGSASGSITEQGSSITVKASFDQGNGGMGLDGSAHNQKPRRSHAVAIRDPNEKSVQNSTASKQSSLRDCPQEIEVLRNEGDEPKSEILDFIPSPSLIAQMENLILSPTQDGERDHSAADSHQRSESSVNTDDFFPGHAAEHSSSKFKSIIYEVQVGSCSWMPKEGEPAPRKSVSTPSRPPNKFVFNDDSPSERYFSSATDANGVARETSAEGAISDVSPFRLHMRESIVTNPDELVGLGIDPGHSISHGIEQASRRVATLPSSSPRRSLTYWDGYRTGIQQDVMGDNKDEDFRIGYRDGLLKSTIPPKPPANTGLNNRAEQKSSPAMYACALRDERGDEVPFMGRDVIFPTFSENPAPISPIPGAPSNSLATTPTRQHPIMKARSPALEQPLDSPSARADFMSQPNINIRNSSFGGAGTRSSKSEWQGVEGTSPLAKRHVGRGASSDLSYVIASTNGRADAFDQQRYQKSAAVSVIQTNHHACGYFPSYDGSAEDEKPVEGTSTTVQSLSSPGKSDGKDRAPASPIKRRTSAAVATMKQVAGRATKKEESRKDECFTKKKKKEQQDPAKMSSPEKKQWREKWARNFRQMKKEEQDEIENYKRDEPAR